ncbi:MAG: hypothetical protein ACK559_32665, partial [bacterium]
MGHATSRTTIRGGLACFRPQLVTIRAERGLSSPPARGQSVIQPAAAAPNHARSARNERHPRPQPELVRVHAPRGHALALPRQFGQAAGVLGHGPEHRQGGRHRGHGQHGDE